MAKFRMRDGSGTVELKYILEDTDRHGNARIYVRKKGKPMIRLRETPGTTAFLAEYRAALAKLDGAEAKAPSPAPASLNWLIERYYASAEFRRLDKRTQRVRRLILDKIRARKGSKPYRLMQARHVAMLRDEKADFPEAANAIVKALRQVFAWAMLPHVGHAEHNPARDVPYLQSGSEGFHSWTIDEVEQFEARHPIGTKARLALALLLYTGQRRSDVVRMGRQHVRDGWLTITQAKNQRRKPVTVSIPILPILQEVIDATPSGHMNFLVTEFGKPFTPAGFGNWFRKQCDEAGLRHCSAHGLRKAGAAIAAENGATERQLMAIYGWQTMKEAERYTRAARQKVLAAEAMPLLSRQRKSNKGVAPEAASGVAPDLDD